MLANFFKIQGEFNGFVGELLDAFDTAPENIRKDLAALLDERRLDATLSNLQLLHELTRRTPNDV